VHLPRCSNSGSACLFAAGGTELEGKRSSSASATGTSATEAPRQEAKEVGALLEGAVVDAAWGEMLIDSAIPAEAMPVATQAEGLQTGFRTRPIGVCLSELYRGDGDIPGDSPGDMPMGDGGTMFPEASKLKRFGCFP